MKETVDGVQKNVYYYEHDETACYYCMVNASEPGITKLEQNYSSGKINKSEYQTKLIAYYKAVARERYNLVKLSDYVNGSTTQYK